MLTSFLESIKYVGHLWPVTLLRIYMGYYFVKSAFGRMELGYLDHAYISEKLSLYEMNSLLATSYFNFLKFIVTEYWYLTSYVLIGMELLIGISFILGLGVRIGSLLGMFLAFNMMWFFDFSNQSAQLFILVIHALFFLLGAGRCLGIDFHFYKSRRGLLW